MFKHIFKYKLKIMVRSKSIMIWTLIFPLILATLFGLAFSNLDKGKYFTTISLGIVENEALHSNILLQESLKVAENIDIEPQPPKETLPVSETMVSSAPILPFMKVVSFPSLEAGKKALENNEISGLVIDQAAAPHALENLGQSFDKVALFFKQSGLEPNLIKNYFDTWAQNTQLEQKNTRPQNTPPQNTLPPDTLSTFIEDISIQNAEAKLSFGFFYALLAMAGLYGAFLGISAITSLQANQSPEGARTSLAPCHKLKMLLPSLLSAILLQFTSLGIVFIYLYNVQKIRFGNQWLFILLLAFMSCVLGVGIGAFITAIGKKKLGINIALSLGINMFSLFLAGLYAVQIKYIVAKHFPLVGALNPATLITDAYYSLYYLHDTQRYWQNTITLFLLSLIIYLTVYIIMRRQDYASL